MVRDRLHTKYTSLIGKVKISEKVLKTSKLGSLKRVKIYSKSRSIQ
ncbi:MAG: hypothetical protein HPY66_1843 [Firmicutes bacterium]|nr:hypothetical protein [Bacillota bacterium]